MSSTQQLIRARKNAAAANPSPMQKALGMRPGKKRGQHAKKNGPRNQSRVRKSTGR